MASGFCGGLVPLAACRQRSLWHRFQLAGALGVHLEGDGYMDEVNCRSHVGDVLREQSAPYTEGWVGGDHQ